MASTISRRQQVRNERLLQDLLKSVPGNDVCADCGARNPGWASWSLGIFLCMRCAALHRKLGTHLSKVKSLSMDSWSNEHIENMKRIGNVESNRTFNPRNVKPAMPVDIDEVDGAMERFIRQKYEHRVYGTESRPGTRQNTGSTSSAEDRPPPLPPKPTKKFGFGLRATSATFPASRHSSGKSTPPISPGFGVEIKREPSPPRVNKASRVFGSNIDRPGDSFESKLTTLRDMGFPDEKRNATVLKGLNGNVDRTVEALIRLGDGSRLPSRSHTPNPQTTASTGISFDRRKSPTATKSINPFDLLDKPQPPTPQEQSPPLPTQAQFSAAPAQSPTPLNPFLTSQPSQPSQPMPQSLNQSFQNLTVSQTQLQQLFPHSTGGYNQPTATNMNPFLQSFTPPPMPQLPVQYGVLANPQPPYQQNQNQWTPQSATPSSPSAGGNPFLRATSPQVLSAPSSAVDSNPFGNQTSFAGSPTFTAQPQAQYQTQQALQSPQTQQSFQSFQGQQAFQQGQQAFQPTQAQPAFLPPQAQQAFPPPQAQSPNPFLQQSFQQPISSPVQQVFTQLNAQSQQAAFASNPGNPFHHPSSPQPQQFQQQPFSQQQPVGVSTQPSQADKQASVLAMYNYPQFAPPRPVDATTALNSEVRAQGSPFGVHRSVTLPNLAAMAGSSTGTPATSASSPGLAIAGSPNPFGSSMTPAASNPLTSQQSTVSAPNPAVTNLSGFAPGTASTSAKGAGMPQFSRDSVDFAGLMAGRHSPDAFKGLSSRWGVS